MPSKRISLKGKGADLFFGDYSPTQSSPAEVLPDDDHTALEGLPEPILAAEAPPPTPTAAPGEVAASIESESPREPALPRRPAKPRETQSTSRVSDSRHASTIASSASNEQDATIATIRRTVRTVGKEVSFVRMTPEEKALLADIVYTYKRQGQKTSETEINRIAINALLLDYQEYGEQSVLARVLASLRA